MTPEDPRHGTTAGHNAGCRCQPCSQAKLTYDKRRELDLLSGKTRTVPAWRVRRRIEALQALGWGLRAIANEAGVHHNHIYRIDRDTVYASTLAKIDVAYERLSMRLPNPQTQGEKSGYVRTRNHARRNGFVPPLGWANIDDPDETPVAWAYAKPDANVRREDFLRDLIDAGSNISEAVRTLKISRDALQQWCKRRDLSALYLTLSSREQRTENQHTRDVA